VTDSPDGELLQVANMVKNIEQVVKHKLHYEEGSTKYSNQFAHRGVDQQASRLMSERSQRVDPGYNYSLWNSEGLRFQDDRANTCD
jgi:hypothetical protein